MCTALYLAAATAPPLVPWVEAKPGLHVYAPDGGHESTRTQFTLPYVVQLGAYSGCACGFVYSRTPALSKQQRDEEEASSVCLVALADYLDALIAVAGPVQLRMSYYAGDNRPAERVLHRTTGWFRDRAAFDMEEGDLVHVGKCVG